MALAPRASASAILVAMRSSSVPYTAVNQARSAEIALRDSEMISFIWTYVGTRSLQPAIRTKKPSGTTPRAFAKAAGRLEAFSSRR